MTKINDRDVALYINATRLAQQLRQTVGAKNDLYITLAQLMSLFEHSE